MSTRLLTIPLSHYCERARWALDHAEVDYEETQYLQLFSWFPALHAGGRRSLPVLVHDDEVVNDSGEIVRWASARARLPLYPDGALGRDVEAFEQRIAGEFGEEARRFAYGWLFRCVGELLAFNSASVSPLQHIAIKTALPLATGFGRRYLGLRPEAVRAAEDVVRRTMDEVAARLEDGRPHLFGDAFTAADLTFAALGAVCVAPSRYGVPFPQPDEIPDAIGRAFVLEMREHPAGRFILRMYDARPIVRARLARPPRVNRA